jgi:hypothetical protein
MGLFSKAPGASTPRAEGGNVQPRGSSAATPEQHISNIRQNEVVSMHPLEPDLQMQQPIAVTQEAAHAAEPLQPPLGQIEEQAGQKQQQQQQHDTEELETAIQADRRERQLPPLPAMASDVAFNGIEQPQMAAHVSPQPPQSSSYQHQQQQQQQQSLRPANALDSTVALHGTPSTSTSTLTTTTTTTSSSSVQAHRTGSASPQQPVRLLALRNEYGGTTEAARPPVTEPSTQLQQQREQEPPPDAQSLQMLQEQLAQEARARKVGPTHTQAQSIIHASRTMH